MKVKQERSPHEALTSSDPPLYVRKLSTTSPLNVGQKLLRRGPRAISTTDLLELLIGGKRRTAERLLRRYGLSGLAEVTAKGLRGEGLSPTRASRLCAVYELARRAYGDVHLERPKLCRPQEVYEHVKHLAALKKEHLVGLYLNAQNGLIHQETISVGSLNTTRTHPREILHPAIQHLALGFILAHNHPSGCPEPSSEDIEFTRNVQRAAELMGIELYDHLVVARDGFTSLRERGFL